MAEPHNGWGAGQGSLGRGHHKFEGLPPGPAPPRYGPARDNIGRGTEPEELESWQSVRKR